MVPDVPKDNQDSPNSRPDSRIVVDNIPAPSRKFGKQIQKRQLEIPEYAASFVDYKALKKVTIQTFTDYVAADWFPAHQDTERDSYIATSRL
jgi:hypothetical protein